jgi:hypothetical protein
MVIVVLIFLQSTLKAIKIILLEIESLKDKPVASFVQLLGIVLNVLGLLDDGEYLYDMTKVFEDFSRHGISHEMIMQAIGRS